MHHGPEGAGQDHSGQSRSLNCCRSREGSSNPRLIARRRDISFLCRINFFLVSVSVGVYSIYTSDDKINKWFSYQLQPVVSFLFSVVSLWCLGFALFSEWRHNFFLSVLKYAGDSGTGIGTLETFDPPGGRGAVIYFKTFGLIMRHRLPPYF